MTLEEHSNILRSIAEKTGERLSERVLIVSATRMLASMQNRIFRDGKDSNGNKIGSYSTKPAYFTKEQFVKKSAFKPVGKKGFRGEKVVEVYHLKKYNPKRKQFARQKGKAIVKTEVGSMYLAQGYKQFREIQGRPTNEVNLMMKGDLRLSLTLQAKDKEVQIGFNNEKQSLKRKGLEKHFKGAIGTIFPATEGERKEYSEEVLNEVNTISIEILKGLS